MTERLARHLLDRERGGGADATSELAAAERVLRKLDVSLSRWFGREGTSAVLNRSLTQARVKHPLLEKAGFTSRHGVVELTGLTIPEGTGTAELTGALTAVISCAIDVLRRFIGDTMVARLLDRMWEGELPAGMFEEPTHPADDRKPTDGKPE